MIDGVSAVSHRTSKQASQLASAIAQTQRALFMHTRARACASVSEERPLECEIFLAGRGASIDSFFTTDERLPTPRELILFLQALCVY